METQGNIMVKDRFKDYGAIVRKDGYTWAADLYKDGKIFYKSWLYNFKTKKSLLQEIESLGVGFGSY